MNLILFLAGVFLITFLLGLVLEEIKIPWIFAALLLGLLLSIYNPYNAITSSPSFDFLSKLGMYFLLFIIGFELDIKNLIKQGSFIVKTTAVIIIAETVLGSLLVHYLFGVGWFVSVVVATSFSTVGEAILLPILDEFKLVKTTLGQTILSIGVLDDLIEILVILTVSVMVSKTAGYAHLNIWVNIIILCALFILVFAMHRLHSEIRKVRFGDIHLLFIFVLFTIFLFIGVGQYVESGALGAILAGIALRNMMPHSKMAFVDSEIRTVSYGLFAPIFFLSVGLNTDVLGLINLSDIMLIGLVVIVTAIAKILGSYLVGKPVLGTKKSLVMGVSLMVKLSTSIVVLDLLLESNIISSKLFSVLVAATAIFTLGVPVLLTELIKHWKIGTK